MNTIKFTKHILLLTLFASALFSCVHDDDYDTPPITCGNDLTSNITIAELKNMYTGGTMEITEDLVLEGYVSSSDREGNIYKTIYIQDALQNPTQGFTLSVDLADTYTQYPVGSKIFVKLKGLYLGEYGGVVQLGALYRDDDGTITFGRMPASLARNAVVRGCDEPQAVTPKTITINDFNDNLIGALIKLENVEVTPNYLCITYAIPEDPETNQQAETTNVILSDCPGNTVTLRNSGFANFAGDLMPGGKGSVTAILSKYVSFGGSVTWQIYIRDTSDVNMDGTRCDGTDFSCDAPAPNATIQDLKNLYTGNTVHVENDMNVKATVTANDISGNLEKLIYVEDETGGIQVRLNKENLNFETKYKVGSVITIAAKDLDVGTYGGEFQLGDDDGSAFRIPENEIYKHIFYNEERVDVAPTVIEISNVTENMVGRLVRFENVEFPSNLQGQTYAGSSPTNRTFQDCQENTLTLRTDNDANFASQQLPLYNGSLTGVLGVFNGTYQLWLRDINDVNMESTRCDGTVPPEVLYQESFNDFNGWTAANITGPQAWNISNQGTGSNYYVRMSGYDNGSVENEDWLISPALEIPTGYPDIFINLDSAVRYNGPRLEAYITTNYTGDVTTTTWETVDISLDTDTNSWDFVNSGNLSISSYAGQTVYVAFKYTSTSSNAATWEIDNFRILGAQ